MQLAQLASFLPICLAVRGPNTIAARQTHSPTLNRASLFCRYTNWSSVDIKHLSACLPIYRSIDRLIDRSICLFCLGQKKHQETLLFVSIARAISNSLVVVAVFETISKQGTSWSFLEPLMYFDSKNNTNKPFSLGQANEAFLATTSFCE